MNHKKIAVSSMGMKGHVYVERADIDGDVYLEDHQWGNYYDCKSAQRLAKALLWAAQQPQKRTREL